MPAKQLANALAADGWTVWWDRTIPPGSSFDEVIETHLMQARCVVVLWSEAALASNWVKEEAEEGQLRGILIPVLIAAVRPPIGFRRIQAADLTSWKGKPSHEGYQQLLMAIRALLGDVDKPNTADLEIPTQESFDHAETVTLASESTQSESTTSAHDAIDATAGMQTASAASSQLEQIPRTRFPLWLSPIVALTLIAVVYFSLNYQLSQNSNTVVDRIESLVRQAPVAYRNKISAEPASKDGDSNPGIEIEVPRK